MIGKQVTRSSRQRHDCRRGHAAALNYLAQLRHVDLRQRSFSGAAEVLLLSNPV